MPGISPGCEPERVGRARLKTRDIFKRQLRRIFATQLASGVPLASLLRTRNIVATEATVAAYRSARYVSTAANELIRVVFEIANQDFFVNFSPLIRVRRNAFFLQIAPPQPWDEAESQTL